MTARVQKNRKTGQPLALADELTAIVQKRWAILSLYLVALSYLFLLQYCMHYGLNLRVHETSVASLLPWLLLTIVLVLVFLVGGLGVLTLVGHLRLCRGGQLLHHIVLAPDGASERDRRKAAHAWILVIAAPILTSNLLTVGLAAIDGFERWQAPVVFFVLPLVIGVLLTRRTLRQRGYSGNVWFYCGYVGATSVSLALLGLYLFGIGPALIDHLGGTGNFGFWFGLIATSMGLVGAYWLAFDIAFTPAKRGAGSTVLAVVLVSITFLAIAPGPSSFLAKTALSMVGIGGVPMQFRVESTGRSGDSPQEVAAVWTEPVLLLLDQGGALYVRSCASISNRDPIRIIPIDKVVEERRVNAKKCRPPQEQE